LIAAEYGSKIHTSQAGTANQEGSETMTTRSQAEQAALIEELTVSWVNENAERIQALSAMSQLNEEEIAELIKSFIADQIG